MKRTFKLLLITSSVLLSGAVFASPQNKPTVCPSVASIVTEGVEVAQEWGARGKGWMVAKLKSKYDTQDEWSFVLAIVGGDTSEAAIATGKMLLPTLSYIEGPMDSNYRKDASECRYESSLSPLIYAIAVNPPYTEPPTLIRMLKAKR